MPIGTFLGAYAVLDIVKVFNPPKKKKKYKNRYKKKYKKQNDNFTNRYRKTY